MSYSEDRQAVNFLKSEQGNYLALEEEKRKNGIKGIQQNHQINKILFANKGCILEILAAIG